MVDHEVFHHLSKGIATSFVKIYGKHFYENCHTLIKGTPRQKDIPQIHQEEP